MFANVKKFTYLCSRFPYRVFNKLSTGGLFSWFVEGFIV